MVETKKCSDCPEGKNIKPVTEFSINGNRYRSRCKACTNKYNRLYKEANKDKIKKYNHSYSKENRKQIQRRQNITRSKRKLNDFGFFISDDLRSKLYHYVSSKCSRNKDIIENIISCSSEKFMLWLLFLFDENMTFSNYGTYWTMDHVDPVAEYDMENIDEIYLCFFWMNLRPLKKIENS